MPRRAVSTRRAGSSAGDAAALASGGRWPPVWVGQEAAEELAARRCGLAGLAWLPRGAHLAARRWWTRHCWACW